MNFIDPNKFQLSGLGLQIEYTTSGLDGKPILNYQNSDTNKAFFGKDIRIVNSELGTIVSVTIQASTNSGPSTTFSMLIPKVNIYANEIAQIKTQGIKTIHRPSNVPTLNHGQLDMYSAITLEGTAQYVFN